MGGVGKTTLLSTLPGKGLVIDIPQIEGGTSVLEGAENIKVLPILRWTEFDAAYKMLAKDHDLWDWVALDTATATQELAKRQVMKDREGDLSQDPKATSQQDWGKIANLNGELYYKFNMLPMHFIMLAQERKRGNDGEESYYHPEVSPASLQALGPPQNLIGRLFTVDKEGEDEDEPIIERQLMVGPHRQYMAKARCVPGRELPRIIAKPNLGRILAYMMGKEVKKPRRAKAEDSLFG